MWSNKYLYFLIPLILLAALSWYLMQKGAKANTSDPNETYMSR